MGDLIVQRLPNNQVATKFLIETAIVNITNNTCPLLFINNMSNSIKPRQNQLLAVAKHTLESVAIPNDFQVAAATSDHDLTDHEPAPLNKSFPPDIDMQKLNFALNKMIQKTTFRLPKRPRPRYATAKPRCLQPPW
uniref:Uncharacterized protein n=1 Tax=Romanomermis culicivorax TaxID=13658 RepID=A0A915IA85_ROMCU